MAVMNVTIGFLVELHNVTDNTTVRINIKSILNKYIIDKGINKNITPITLDSANTSDNYIICFLNPEILTVY